MRLLPADPPVEPGRDEAEQLLVDELSKPEYTAAQPTWFDLLVQSVLDWFGRLELPLGDAAGFPWWLAVLAVIGVLIAITVIRVVGLPRLRRRRNVVGALFGEQDTRDAATMRRDARRAASAGDYTTAIAELYRAMARDLDERTIVSVMPGTTAHGFAHAAGASFPAEAVALQASAADFDTVRYLGGTGTAEQWERLVALDERIRAARPLLAELPA